MTTTQRLQTFSMPDVGEGLTEAEVLQWRVAVGDTLTMNQVIVEIETAKAAVELPSPFAGRVEALLVDVGVTVRVGTPIITVDTQPGAGELPPAPARNSSEPAGQNGMTATENGAGAKIGEVTPDGRIATLVGYVSAGPSSTRRTRRGTASPAVTIPQSAPQSAPQTTRASPPTTEPASATIPSSGEAPPPRAAAPLATPPVRKLAKELGIDLTAVTATRPDGVISRSDVENASAAEHPAEHVATSGAPPAGYDPATRELRVAVKGVRKATAAAMVASAFTAPHVTEFLTVDVTPMMELRDRLRRRPQFADIKLTPLAFAARAVCLAVRRTPELNAVLDEAAGEIVIKQYVHLGIAAATPRGLVVPVIRDADGLDLAGVAHALTELAATARAGKTSLAEMTGGTFSITNIGVFGVDTGTPIINPGESAILALGSIKDAPWVVDGELAVRKVCQLALSFDHRVVDGQQGSQFLSDVGALLADPGLALAF
jgi:2-oxoisovalerate dehydrogenase E2 component (dihydrolipoyl transacylase)